MKTGLFKIILITCILVLPSTFVDGQTRYRNAASISGVQNDQNSNNNTSDVTPKPKPIATFSYATDICKDAENQLPAMGLYALKGGFSATPSGIVFENTTTGEINISASNPGNYIITNTIDETADYSANYSSFALTIHELPTISGTLSICVGSSVQLTGSGIKALLNPWVSTEISVALIDNNGIATGISAGHTDIIYTDMNGCINKVTLTVNSVPLGFNDQVSSLNCTGLVDYNLQNNVNNLLKGGNGILSEFTWTVSVNTNVTGAEDGSGNTIHQHLINISNTEQNVVYTVTPKAIGTGTCLGNPFTVSVVIPVCSSVSIHKTADITSNAKAGDIIHYAIAIENTGNANHSNVVVTDPYLGGILTNAEKTVGNADDILEKGEIWTYSGIYTVLQSDINNNGKPIVNSGKIQNTATVSTNNLITPEIASCDVTLEDISPKVTLVKTISGNVPVTIGGVLNYNLQIKNTGNVTLTNLIITDTKAIVSGNPVLSLAPGVSTTLTASHILTQEDIISGSYSNSAVVSGQDPFNKDVTDISGTQQGNDDPTVAILNVSPPVSLNDNVFTTQNTNVTILVLSNDDFGLNGPSTSAITSINGAHGTVTVLNCGTPNDPTDDKLSYTPEKGYYGTDTFDYTICNSIGLSTTATVTVTINPLSNLIQAFKSTTVPVQNPDETFSWKYSILLKNMSNQRIDSIHIQDDLVKVFDVSPMPSFEIISISASGNLIPNSLYNGNSNINLLLDRSYLEGNAKDSISFEIKIQPNYFTGIVFNQAVFEGLDVLGNKFNGALTDDVTLPGPVDPTQTTIPETLSIPDAFSPNDDGKNDQYVIPHSSNLKLLLEIYNRWGNRVYISNDYQNDWDGKGVDNFLGQDLPAGTYYYILQTTNTNTGEVYKYMNFLTLRR